MRVVDSLEEKKLRLWQFQNSVLPALPHSAPACFPWRAQLNPHNYNTPEVLNFYFGAPSVSLQFEKGKENEELLTSKKKVPK